MFARPVTKTPSIEQLKSISTIVVRLQNLIALRTSYSSLVRVLSTSAYTMAAPTRWNRPERFLFEHDERWTKVDEYNWSHLHAKGAYPDTKLMESVLESSEFAGLPPIAVAPAHGKFLQLQAKMLQAKTILEVGMLGGYSTIWLATSHPDVKVTSIELDTEFAKVAKKHFELAGVSDRIEVVLGSALDKLPGLLQEVKDGKRPKIDMAFIDANKENNLEYFNTAVEMARPGGLHYCR
jgi:predicted O-methyltransferase YrrM